MTDWSAAHPLLAERVQALQAMYARRYAPETLVVTSILRSDAQQIALFAQGRQSLAQVNVLRAAAGMTPIDVKANAHRVTNCDGVHNRSRHQGVLYEGRMVSRAVDLAPSWDADGPGTGKPIIDWNDRGRFNRIGPLAESVGLMWGGNWISFQDLPHVELPADVPNTAAVAA